MHEPLSKLVAYEANHCYIAKHCTLSNNYWEEYSGQLHFGQSTVSVYYLTVLPGLPAELWQCKNTKFRVY